MRFLASDVRIRTTCYICTTFFLLTGTLPGSCVPGCEFLAGAREAPSVLSLQPDAALHLHHQHRHARLLPAARVRREGQHGRDRAAGAHRLPAAGGRVHAAPVQEHPARRLV